MALRVVVAAQGVALSIAEQEDGALPHRRVLQPGAVSNGAWVDADLAGEPGEVKAAAAEAWTAEAVADYREAMEAAYQELISRPVEVPLEISDWQFATVLRLDGVISQAEAEDFCGAGVIPSLMASAIDTIPDQPLRDMLRIKVRGAKVYNRLDYATQALASLMGYSPEQVADIWTRGAAI